MCPTLCDPMDCSLPGSSVHGIFQARILEWVAISFSRGSSQPRDQTQVSHNAGRLFTIWATREAYIALKMEIRSGSLISLGLNIVCKNASKHSEEFHLINVHLHSSYEEVYMLGFSTTGDANGDWVEMVAAIPPWRSTCLGTKTEAKFTC